MIQRTQTLFMILTIIFISLFILNPIWYKIDLKNNINILNPFGFQVIKKNNIIFFKRLPYSILGTLSIVGLIISLIQIFLYKNRILQIFMGKMNSIIIFATISLSSILIFRLVNKIGKFNIKDLKIGFLLIIAAFVCNFISNIYIKKDEDLVKSAERLR